MTTVAPAFETNSVTVYKGHVLDVLREMPDERVDCVVTSPPYWGLRDYGVVGQIGLERTPDEYVAVMVEVFREIRRVLRSHGTLWLNLGDSYAARQRNTVGSRHVDGLKAKDLVGIPWRVAFAMQADGWCLRSDIVWAKPNAMPESVIDRPTKAHEYVFLFAKEERYYFDQEAVREPHSREWWNEAVGGQKIVTDRNDGGDRQGTGTAAGRNVRSVWTIATRPYPEAHFATFPRELPERCIKAGCPEQVCSRCGKPRERIVEREGLTSREWKAIRGDGPKGADPRMGRQGKSMAGGRPPDPLYRTTGWADCGHDAYLPGVVLDPFAGSGTTLVVARDLGRQGIGIELNQDYIRLIERRCAQLALDIVPVVDAEMRAT